MTHETLAYAFCVLAACDLDSTVNGQDADAAIDAPADATIATCDPEKPFDTPVNLGPNVNSTLFEFGARLSADQLTLYFTTSDDADDSHIAAATRPTVQEGFGPRTLVDELNSAPGISERDPTITGNGLTIYFASTRIGGGVSNDLFVAARPTTTALFGTPALVAGVNTANNDLGPAVMPDGNTLYLASDRLPPNNTMGIFRSVRAGGTFEMPIHIPELGDAFPPTVTPDELTIYFSRNEDLFISRRSTTADGFGTPMPVTELNTPQKERPSWISPDGCTLYFDSDRDGGVGSFDVYAATRMR